MSRVVAGALVAVALMATAEAGPSRADALAALTASDVEARRMGARALLESGTMADAPALLRALRDPDGQVRQEFLNLKPGRYTVVLAWAKSGDLP